MKYETLVVLLFLTISSIQTLDLVRKTRHGLIRGLVARSESNSSVEYYAFRGVPYGRPMVGNLRFQEPLPPEDWLDVKNVYASANYCVQMSGDNIIGSEDCLYLDVFEPKTARHQGTKLLPVMVWIHGGGFAVGSSNETGPDYLMEKPIVIVSIQYRLNVFGFLTTKDKYAKGNLAFKDQVLALKWVKENIENFGGDPNMVTIFGESAGGACILYHTVSPKSQGLFHRAISQSGSTLGRWALQERPLERLWKLAKGLGIETNSTKLLIEELQLIDHEILLRAADNSSIVGIFFPYYAQPFAPIIESDSETAFISESTFEILKEGKFNKVPSIIGFNTEEGSLAYSFVNSSLIDINIYETNPELLIPISMNVKKESECYDEVLKQIRSFYFKNGPVTNKENWINYMSQEIFVRAIMKSVEFMYDLIPVYLYRFSYSGSNPMSFLGGVGHYEEVQYLWRLPGLDPNLNMSESDKLTSKRMVTMWTNFAATGNPTPESDELLQNLFWPKVNSSAAFLDIGNNLTTFENLEQENVEFWETLFALCGTPPYNTY